MDIIEIAMRVKSLCTGFDDTTPEEIDEAAKKGISRTQWVSSAIESTLHREGDDIMSLRRE